MSQPPSSAPRAWYKRYPADALAGMMVLTCEEKGAYNTVLDLIYQRGGAIQDDPQHIARMCGCSTRRWNQLRARLIELGKLAVIDGNRLSNPRSERQIKLEERESRAFRENGEKGAEKKAQARNINGIAHKGLDLPAEPPKPGSETIIPGKTPEKSEIKSPKIEDKSVQNQSNASDINNLAEKGLCETGQHHARVLRDSESIDNTIRTYQTVAREATAGHTGEAESGMPERPPPLIEMRFMPPRNARLAAWRPLADTWERRTPIDPEIPCCGGYELPWLIDAVCEAARIADPEFRTDWSPLIRWVRDGIDPHEVILPTIARMAALPGYSPPRWLSMFDRTVRAAAARKRAA